MKASLLHRVMRPFSPSPAPNTGSTPTNAPSPLVELPDDLLERVFAQLSAHDLLAATATRQSWHRVALSRPSLWTQHARDWGVRPAPDLPGQVAKIAWRVAVDKRIRTRCKPRKLVIKQRTNHAVSWSSESTRLLATSQRQVEFNRAKDRRDALIDVATGRQLAQFRDPYALTKPSWSADGRCLLLDEPGNVRVVSAACGTVLATLKAGGAPVWNSKRSQFAVGGEGCVRIFDSQGAQLRCLTLSSSGFRPALKWSPQGDRLAICQGAGADIIDALTGALRARLERAAPINLGPSYPTAPHWSRDGRHVALAWDNAATLHDADSGRQVGTLPSPGTRWAPDSRHLASAGGDSVHVLSTEGATRSFQVGAPVQRLAWSPQGSKLAVLVDRRATALIDLALTQPLRTNLPDQLLLSPDLSWSPDGTRYVVSAPLSRGSLIDAATGQLLASSPQRAVWDGNGDFVAWNPDGTRLAFFGRDLTSLLDAISGHTLATLPNDHRRTSELWNPEGSKLVVHASGELSIHNADGRLLGRFPCGPSSRRFWSPDGSKLALMQPGKKLRVLDFAPGRGS